MKSPGNIIMRIAIIMFILIISACVNEEYDLSKDIDTEATLLRNMSMPIGGVQKINLSEILSLEEDSSSIIKKDENGDFIFSFIGDLVSTVVNSPEFEFDLSSDINTEPITVYFETGIFDGLDPSLIPDDLVYSEITGNPLESSMDIIIDSELPVEIKDIRKIFLDASLAVNFSVNSDSVHLKEGFEFEFPEFIHVVNETTDDSYSVIDNRTLVLNEDVVISDEAPLTLGIRLDEINVPFDAIVDGRIQFDEDIIVNGDFYLSPSDFSEIPENIVMDILIDIVNIDIISVDVLLDLQQTIDGSVIAISSTPEIFNSGDICLDIYNPCLSFTVANSSPISFDVAVDIHASKGDKNVAFSLGEEYPISIPSYSSISYAVSRKRLDLSDGRTNIVIPEIADMISMVPETIGFEKIFLTSSNDDYVTIVNGDEYKAGIYYYIYAPLAFDEDLKINFTQDVTDLGISFEEVGIRHADIYFSIENSVPLDFSIRADALDAQGNVIDGLSLSVDKEIEAGTHTSPKITDLILTLKSSSEDLSFDGLRFNFMADSPSSELLGIPLNENQGFEIKNLSLTIPEGITIKDINNE